MSLDYLNNLCSEKDTSYVQFCMITMNMIVIDSANGLCSIQSIALDCIPLLSITILTYTYLWELLSSWSWPRNGGQQKSNWQTTLSTWLKTTPWAQAPEVCEKTFSTYFISQPVENTLTYSQIFIKDNQDNQVIRAVTKSRGPGISLATMRVSP